MQLSYGSYQFGVSACDVKTRSETLRNRGGQPYAYKAALDVCGYLQDTGQSALTNDMGQLWAALSVPYQDLVLSQDSGAPSATRLANGGSTSGVVITRGPGYPRNNGGEYSTMRYFEFTAEAEYPLPNTAQRLLWFTEKLKFRGGGPKRVMLEAAVGPAQPQITRQQTIYEAWQTGESIGYLQRPIAPQPIWPFALIEINPEAEVDSPELKGKAYEGFKISWAYHFMSAKPLIGIPNIWLPT